MSYLFIVLLLGTLILIHEAGHLAAALWMRIPISRFSIGFGPRLAGFRWRGTDYWLSAVPLGGYVMPDVDDAAGYFRISPWRRIVFALGGPAANVLVAVLLFAGLNGLANEASLAGLFVAPWAQTADVAAGVFGALGQLATRPDALSGVVGIVAEGGKFVSGDAARALEIAILLSVNLAVFNLLPIPALDGGKILLHLAEMAVPRAERLFVPLSVLGWVFLIALTAYATALDLYRYLQFA